MQNENFTNNEQETVKSATLTSDELINRIYKGESTPQDSRFLSANESGVFKYFRLESLIGLKRLRNSIVYPIIEIDHQIIGLAGVQKDPNKENNYWIKFISVDPKYQNKGYASLLLNEVFRFAKEQDCSLEASIYTGEGEQKLKRVFHELGKKFSVRVIDEH